MTLDPHGRSDIETAILYYTELLRRIPELQENTLRIQQISFKIAVLNSIPSMDSIRDQLAYWEQFGAPKEGLLGDEPE